eukprot:SAG22_NODE_364_length_11652_cov_5.071497_3_plen_265_part_00
MAKPAFRAFELLNGAGAYTVPVLIDDPAAAGSISAFATVQTATAAAAAEVAAAAAGGGGAGTDAAALLRGLRVYISNFLPNIGLPPAPVRLTIELSGLVSAAAAAAAAAGGSDVVLDIKATAHVIDATHANPKAAWAKMGQGGSQYGPDRYLDAAELHRLRLASEVVPVVLATKIRLGNRFGSGDAAAGGAAATTAAPVLAVELSVGGGAAAGLPAGSDGAAIMVEFGSLAVEKAVARAAAAAKVAAAQAELRRAWAALERESA